jgi:hypothetical protein
MGVSQENGVDLPRIDREALLVPQPELLETLEEPAVDEKSMLPGRDECL